MSTCPHKDLLSAYIDDELPSPWKETVAQHMQQCSTCKQIYNTYSAVHRVMQETSADRAFDAAAFYAKVLVTRNSVLQKKANKQRERRIVTAVHRFFSSSVRIPVPIAAAAVLLFVFAPLMVFFQAERDGYAAASDHTPFTPILPISIEQQRLAGEVDYGITHTDGVQGTAMPLRPVTANTKLFTVGSFARLYSPNEHLFEPVESTVDLRLSTYLFPLSTEYQLFDAPVEIGMH